MDDISLLLCGTREELMEFDKYLNMLHDLLQFFLAVNLNNTYFLDVDVACLCKLVET